MAEFPSIIYGTVSGDGRLVGGIKVNVKNSRTEESIQTTTTARGDFAVDAGNYDKGYQVGDTVVVSVHGDDMPEYDANVRVDNGRIELK